MTAHEEMLRLDDAPMMCLSSATGFPAGGPRMFSLLQIYQLSVHSHSLSVQPMLDFDNIYHVYSCLLQLQSKLYVLVKYFVKYI